MTFLSYLRVEISRIFRSKTTWLFIVLTIITPFFGFTIFKLNNVETSATQMILNPVLMGTISAAILFALFTLFELDRVNKYNTSIITDAIAPPTALHIARISAIFTVSIVTILFTILVYLPYTYTSMESFFNKELYLSAYLIYMLPSMWIGSLFAAIFYQVSNRLDISFVFLAAFILLSFADFLRDDFILRWINPNLPVFSDGFGNYRVLRTGLYNRLFWMVFLGGTWIISLLFTRKYGEGILGSLHHNIKKHYISILGMGLIIWSISIYSNQPFYNAAPPEVDWNALHKTGVALKYKSVKAEVTPDLNKNIMYGKIQYVLDNNIGYPAEQNFIINSGYELYSLTANGEELEYTELEEEHFVSKHIQFKVPTGVDILLEVEYGGYPKIWGAYKTGLGGNEISPKNVELRNNSLIPSLGIHMVDINAKREFPRGNQSINVPAVKQGTVDVSIVLPDTFTLLSLDDAIRDIIDNNDGTKTWFLRKDSDYIDIFASEYNRKTITIGDTTVEFYFHKNFTDLLEENDVEEVLMDVFDYCTEHLGPLSYLRNKTLKLIQTTAFNFGGGATNGVSNMGETTFSIYSLTDPIKGASGKELLAHEIIHQWWGLNRMIWEDPDTPEWTSEGLTVYSTYRLYKEKHGEEYGQKYYVEQWESAVKEMRRNFYYRHPEYLDIMPESFAAHLRVRELEIKKYCLMPLMIHKAAELVGGEEAMDVILKELSSSNRHQQLTFQEFLNACGLTREVLEVE